MKSQMLDVRDPTDTLIMNGAGEVSSADNGEAVPSEAVPKRVGHYDLRHEIGRGGMSVVYEAQDTRTGQDVALKLLSLPDSLTPEEAENMIAGFEREARIAVSLSHPNIVRTYKAGPRQGAHLLAMEYLQGQTLQKRLGEKTVTPQEAYPILTQIAGALEAVHAAGVLHRDIKPSNVMLLPDGTVKLLDFGNARLIKDTITRPQSVIVGSPSYMAPEQIKGQTGTRATDVWALGVLGYEMLTGQLPFTSLTVGGVMFQIMHVSPAPMPDLPPAVQKVLMRALDKRPAQRYGTASAFVQALKSAHLGQAPAAPKPKPTVSSPRFAPQWLPGTALLALFLLGLCVTVRMRLSASSFAPKRSAVSNSAQAPIQVSAPPRITQTPVPDRSPTPYSAPVTPVLSDAQAAALPARQTAMKSAAALPQRHSHPIKPITQAAEQSQPVHTVPMITRVPVPAIARASAPSRRPSMESVQIAVQHAQLRTVSRIASRPAAVPYVPVPVAARSVPAPVITRPALVQQTDSAEPAQSADQSVTLPADSGSYDPEADARLRKSAWSQNGEPAHP